MTKKHSQIDAHLHTTQTFSQFAGQKTILEAIELPDDIFIKITKYSVIIVSFQPQSVFKLKIENDIEIFQPGNYVFHKEKMTIYFKNKSFLVNEEWHNLHFYIQSNVSVARINPVEKIEMNTNSMENPWFRIFSALILIIIIIVIFVWRRKTVKKCMNKRKPSVCTVSSATEDH